MFTIKSCAVNQNGDLFAAGFFHGTVDFDPGPAVDTITTNGHDMFNLRLDSSGDFSWIKVIQGTLTPAEIQLDASENIYVAGSFLDTADFDPGVGIYNLFVDTNTVLWHDPDGFVAKYDSAGNFIWAKRIGGNKNDQIATMKMVNNDHLLIGGFTSDTADIDPGPGTYFLETDTNVTHDGFLLKLDTSGTFLWAKQFETHVAGSFNNAVNETFDLMTDAFGNIVVGEIFNGLTGDSIDVDPGISVVNIPITGTDVFSVTNLGVITLDSQGNFKSAIKLADSAAYIRGSNIIPGSYGNILVYGTFYGTLDFDPGPSYYPLTNDTSIYINSYLLSLYNNTTGLSPHVFLNENLLIFPNPTSNKITIAANTKTNISITNTLGEVVLEKYFPFNTQAKVEINVSSLRAGMYVIRAGDKVKKFVKE